MEECSHGGKPGDTAAQADRKRLPDLVLVTKVSIGVGWIGGIESGCAGVVEMLKFW